VLPNQIFHVSESAAVEQGLFLLHAGRNLSEDFVQISGS
jgi:hypothetical protein